MTVQGPITTLFFWVLSKGFCREVVTRVTTPVSLAAIQSHGSVTWVTRDVQLAAKVSHISEDT